MHTSKSFFDSHHDRLTASAKRVFKRIERLHSERTNIGKRINEDLRVISRRETEHLQKIVFSDEEEEEDHAARRRAPSPPATDGMAGTVPVHWSD